MKRDCHRTDIGEVARRGNAWAAANAFIAFGRSILDMLAQAREEPLLKFDEDGTHFVMRWQQQSPAMSSLLARTADLIVRHQDCKKVARGGCIAFAPLDASMRQ